MPPQQHVPKATSHAHQGVDVTELLNAKPAFADSQKEEKRKEYLMTPKRPPSAYVLWAKENRQRLRAPGMRSSEVNKALSDAWKDVSPEERAPWQCLACEARRGYVRELAEYKKAQDAHD